MARNRSNPQLHRTDPILSIVQHSLNQPYVDDSLVHGVPKTLAEFDYTRLAVLR